MADQQAGSVSEPNLQNPNLNQNEKNYQQSYSNENEQDYQSEIEIWRLQSEALKNEGNEAFKQKDYSNAIKFYTQAIEIDPDNHILYSNRSAAHLATGDAKSKALHDAIKCIELKPDFVKGYVRRGASEKELGRFDSAIDTYQQGLRIEPNNQSLQDGLKAVVQAKEAEREVRWEKSKQEREAIKKTKQQNTNPSDNSEGSSNPITSDKNNSQTDEALNGIDDPDLLNLLAEINQSSTGDQPVKNEKILTQKYQQQELGTSDEQIGRLLQPYYEWKNLNPFEVLMLDIDATDEDIRQRYRKLSSLVHPDKSRNEQAREAFEEVKKAYQLLNDEERKKIIILTIEAIREQFEKDKKKKEKKVGLRSNSHLNQSSNEEKIFIQKKFAEIEMRRRNTEKHQRAHQKREREEEEKVKEEQISNQKFEKDWSEEKRRTDRVENWRDFQVGGKNKKVKTQNWNQEERKADKQKYGQVELESWKKSWK